MKVVVTDAHYRMSLAAIRDLGGAGHEVYAVHYGAGRLPPAAKSRYLTDCIQVEDASPEKRAKKTIQAAVRMAGVDEPVVVFTVGAVTAAALAREGEEGIERLGQGRIRILLPTDTQLTYANDKAFVLKAAGKIGIAVPRAYETPTRAAAEQLPVIVKYRNGEALGLKAEERYKLAKTRRELYDIYTGMASRAILAGQDVPLIQEYIAGEGFGVSCVFDRQSRPVSVICHRRLREFPIAGGPSSCCETAWNEQLVGDAVRLLKAMRWTGIAMVEFRGNNMDGYRLMEINPRIWGSFPLTRAAKTGFSDAYVRAAAGEELPEYAQPSYKIGKRMTFFFPDLAAGYSWLRAGDSRRFFRRGRRCRKSVRARRCFRMDRSSRVF